MATVFMQKEETGLNLIKYDLLLRTMHPSFREKKEKTDDPINFPYKSFKSVEFIYNTSYTNNHKCPVLVKLLYIYFTYWFL